MNNERCKSVFQDHQCDTVGKAPHTHHATEGLSHIWWSDADVIAELQEKFQNLLESNPSLVLT